jgi:RHS repeat-associated protein
VSYTYAADGLRTSKTVGSATTTFGWDDINAAVPELIQDGDDYYLYGPDGLPFERAGANPTQWLLTDATGSVTGSTDTTATITGARTYDAWGNITGHSGTPVTLGWQSQYQDPETGLYYLWHRYYDPATAQFTTPDPLNALTGSRYGYAANDPINGTDPTGMFHIPGTSYCVDIGDSNCHSNADGQSLTNTANDVVDDVKQATGICSSVRDAGCEAYAARHPRVLNDVSNGFGVVATGASILVADGIPAAAPFALIFGGVSIAASSGQMYADCHSGLASAQARCGRDRQMVGLSALAMVPTGNRYVSLGQLLIDLAKMAASNNCN